MLILFSINLVKLRLLCLSTNWNVLYFRMEGVYYQLALDFFYSCSFLFCPWYFLGTNSPFPTALSHLALQMGWVEIGLMGWVLIWSVLGGSERVLCKRIFGWEPLTATGRLFSPCYRLFSPCYSVTVAVKTTATGLWLASHAMAWRVCPPTNSP